MVRATPSAGPSPACGAAWPRSLRRVPRAATEGPVAITGERRHRRCSDTASRARPAPGTGPRPGSQQWPLLGKPQDVGVADAYWRRYDRLSTGSRQDRLEAEEWSWACDVVLGVRRGLERGAERPDAGDPDAARCAARSPVGGCWLPRSRAGRGDPAPRRSRGLGRGAVPAVPGIGGVAGGRSQRDTAGGAEPPSPAPVLAERSAWRSAGTADGEGRAPDRSGHRATAPPTSTMSAVRLDHGRLLVSDDPGETARLRLMGYWAGAPWVSTGRTHATW